MYGRQRWRCCGCAIALALALWPTRAQAQEFPAPSDRNYAIDVFVGQALGSARIIGMGGAATATAHGSSGTLANPASPAVRATTSHDRWDWDWHLDSMSGTLGSDHDNNGIDTEDASFSPTGTVGVVGQYKGWGLGFAATGQLIESRVARGPAAGARIRTEALVNRISLARQFHGGDVVVGLSAVGALLQMTSITDEGSQPLLVLTGTGLGAGVVYKPVDRSYRLGLSGQLPIVSDETTVEDCDPLDCAGYILPERVQMPWQIQLGFAARRGATPWNRTSVQRWVDEKALLWAIDLIVTGTTPRGAGLEAFGQRQLQPSGRRTGFSLRGGVDYEWMPGRLRVRGGSYYEPSRFRDPDGQDIPGRLHLTLGADLRVWQFGFWDDQYRVRLSFTSDLAHKFANTGLSLGFWH